MKKDPSNVSMIIQRENKYKWKCLTSKAGCNGPLREMCDLMSRLLIHVGHSRMGPERYACEKNAFHILYCYPKGQDSIAIKTSAINTGELTILTRTEIRALSGLVNKVNL